MELISREDVMRLVESGKLLSGSFGERARDIIESLPTIEERKEGEWVELQQNDDGTHNIQCSVCRFCFKSKGHARSNYTKKHYVFCSHCGAIMKGEER